MCGECNRLLDEAEEILLLAEAEQMLVLAEAEQGVNIPDGRRPLFPHEVRACVRFGDMNDALAHAERLNNAHISKATDDLVAELVRFLPDATSPADAAGILANLTMNPPETVQAILDKLTEQVGDVLASMRTYGHDSVVGEANRQGVELSALADDNYLKRILGKAGKAASGVAAFLWTTVTGRMNTATSSAAAVNSAEVAQTVLKSGMKGTLDLARQATHGQHNEGRKDGAHEAPEPPARIYAGELLDGATCPRCNDIDGYLFESEEEAERWYPEGGPMAYCLGGNRCRGTLIYDWSNLNEEFDGGVDKDSKPRLPFADPATGEKSGVPVLPGVPVVPAPVREDMPQAGRDLYERYSQITPGPVSEKSLKVFYKGVFKNFPSGVVVSQGGHEFYSKMPGKTRFPKSWVQEDVGRAIQAVVSNPGALALVGNTWVLFSYINGVVMQVRLVKVDGVWTVVHAFPVSGTGVMHVDKQQRRTGRPGVQLPENLRDVLHYNDSRLEGK